MLYRKGDLGRQGEVTSMVMRAEDEVLARKIADEWACSRGTNDLRNGPDGWYTRHTFLETKMSYCVDVEAITGPEVLVESTLDDQTSRASRIVSDLIEE